MPVASVEFEIQADYQYRALTRGWALQRAWHRARLDLVDALLPPPSDAPSLDAAAGSGILSYRFPDAPIISTDIRPEACRFIRTQTRRGASVVSTLTALPFADHSMQAGYFLEVIEHLTASDADTALRELRRLMRPAGRLLITTPNYASHWGWIERALDTLRLTPPMDGEQHVTHYDATTLANTLARAGWRTVRDGSFNLYAPIAGMGGSEIGRRALRAELAAGSRRGALLFALCEPRP